MIFSEETTLKVELDLSKNTVVAWSNLRPVISTRVPSGPLVGVMRRISGGSDNPALEIPSRAPKITIFARNFTENYLAWCALPHRKYGRNPISFP